MGVKLILKGTEETANGTIVKDFTVENMEITDDGTLCLISPNETRWKLTVDNDGVLSTEEVTE